MKNHATLSRMFNQPVDKTWEALRDFGCVPVPGAFVTMEGENNTVGSIRTIHYQDGLEIVERLDAYVDGPLQKVLSYSFTKPQVGVEAYSGTWIVYPTGKDGKRSKLDMYLTWETEDEEGNESFESVIVDLLQNVYLVAPDPKKEEPSE